MNIGEEITLGNYAGEPIVWQVIAKWDGRWLLLSRDVLEIRPFHPVNVSRNYAPGESYSATVWANCELRQWLNGDFAAKAFAEEEMAHIPSVPVSYTSIYKTLHSNIVTDKYVDDRIFLLSIYQAKHYISNKNDLRARLTDHAKAQLINPSQMHQDGSWWLRTAPNDHTCNFVQYVFNYQDYAGISEYGTLVTDTDVGVRPAMWYVP